MDVQKKLEILANAAKYDVSCASSGSRRQNRGGRPGNAAQSGICHSFTEDGRCVSLLKILFTSFCIYDCAYCANRVSNDIPRTAFTPAELADLTIDFYRRNFIEGFFISSGMIRNPDDTMEQVIRPDCGILPSKALEANTADEACRQLWKTYFAAVTIAATPSCACAT